MKTYSPDKLEIFPWFIQPKLNGVYAELGTDGLFRSKTGKFFPAVQKVWTGLMKLNTILCGEFYVHGWSLQQVISAVTPDEPNELSRIVEYHTYDTKLPEENAQPPQWLRFSMVPYLIQTERITSIQEGNKWYKYFLSQGYEGAVYRPYYYGELLKRKPFKDAEYVCTGVTEGNGKRKAHVGKFILRTPDGRTFGCGGGRISYNILRELFSSPPLGKLITVRYQHMSDDGIPLCPQFISVRDYE